MLRIGVRELRQNASRYLAQVARGETVEITQHGRPVARLVPVPDDSWEHMIASGRLIPGRGDYRPGDREPMDMDTDLSARLRTMREHER
jgi:prevent-host-death family protein